MTVESGYAAGYNGMMQYVEALLPSREIITSTVRETKREYPPAAVREAIANALIHQDFSVRGSCVLVEIFANRIEVTNPGRPLVDVMRIIDNPSMVQLGLAPTQICATLVMGGSIGSLMPPVSQAIFLSSSLIHIDVDLANQYAYFTIFSAFIVECVY